MNKEKRFILKIAKKNLPSQLYKKIKTLPDEKELKEVVKYAIVSSLEKEFLSLEKEILTLEKELKDVFIVKTKILIFPAKMKFLKAEFHEDELIKVKNLLKEIKRELKHV